MERKLGSWLAVLLRPPLVIIGFVVGGLYKLLFAARDRRLAREQEKRLVADIRTYFSSLFSQNDIRIIPNEKSEVPPPFDYAIVTLENSDILLRFTRGRDHLAVQVASKTRPNHWHELSTVLTALEVRDIQRGSISGMLQASQLLRLHMNKISHALSGEQYMHLKEKLDQIYVHDRVITKQLETELNRNLEQSR